MGEVHRSGLEYLDTVTELLQRIRAAHPTSGSYEAAELQWWWTIPRSTDKIGQLFWIDGDGRPEAAVIATDWGDGASQVFAETTLAVMVLPDASPSWVTHVIERGLAHAAELNMSGIELEVDQADDVVREALFANGFSVKEDGLVECWLDADARPEVSPLAEGYRLVSRREIAHQPHHMAEPRPPEFVPRLEALSLYRQDLDLLVLDGDDTCAAYGLFWYDPVTATGIVEPMRTHDDHQQRGLARHVLTAGVDRLAVMRPSFRL